MEKIKSINSKYSSDWLKSSKYSYEQGLYEWLVRDLILYDYIIEFGCGTGYSTLSLLEKGFKVYAIDSNEYCISTANDMLMSMGYKTKILNNIEDLCLFDYDVMFINIDFEENLSSLNFSFLCSYKVCCLHWNPCRNIEHEYFDKLLNIDNPNDDIEYQTDIIMLFSKENKFDVQLSDRVDQKEFYQILKQDYNYDMLDIQRHVFKYDNSGKKLCGYENMEITTNEFQQIKEINYIKGYFRIV